MDYESFSQLIAPQGLGGTAPTRASGNLYSYQLYSPPVKGVITEPDEQAVVVKPVQRPSVVQPVPTIVVRETMLQLPDANKLEVIGNGMDEVVWENLPENTHWVTYQLGPGGNNEYDYEGTTASLSFSPSTYYIIISAEGYEPKLYFVQARIPLPEEEPVWEEPDPNEEPEVPPTPPEESSAAEEQPE